MQVNQWRIQQKLNEGDSYMQWIMTYKNERRKGPESVMVSARWYNWENISMINESVDRMNELMSAVLLPAAGLYNTLGQYILETSSNIWHCEWMSQVYRVDKIEQTLCNDAPGADSSRTKALFVVQNIGWLLCVLSLMLCSSVSRGFECIVGAWEELGDGGEWVHCNRMWFAVVEVVWM